MVKLCWMYIRAIALIYFSLFAGKAIAAQLPLAIPGSIIGMLILFTLLSLHIVPAPWLKPGCQFFIRYMVLLFVPVSVGVMKYYHQLIDNLAPLIISCLISTLMVFIVVGYTSHYFHHKPPTAGGDKNKEEIK